MGDVKLCSTMGMLININYVPLPEKSALCSEGCSAKRLMILFSLNDCKKPQLIHCSHQQLVFHYLTTLTRNYSLRKRKPLKDLEKINVANNEN